MARRFRHRLLLKSLGITGFMWLFFIAYFHLLRQPVHPVTEMPLTALDRAIPLQPAWLAAYVSLWLYVGIPPGLMNSLRDAAIYGLWMGGLCLVGLACFYLMPTAVPALPPGAELALLQGVDAAGNACPSLHVASAAFTAAWVDRMLRATGARLEIRLVNLAWLVAIVYSTLATKQHVVLDVVAGAALAALFVWPSLRWGPKESGAFPGEAGSADARR